MENIPGEDRLFEKELALFFRQVVRVIMRYPRLIPHYIGTVFNQRKAYQLRNRMCKENVSVPPVLIFSITGKCNLNCSGCYARAHQSENKPDLTTENFKRILGEASGAGTRIVFLVGGEPLLRRDLIAAAATYRKTEFLLFTNGTLLDADTVALLRRNKNLFPMLSMEGYDKATDERRGGGVFARFEKAAILLRDNRVPFGISITVTAENYSQVTETSFVKDMISRGAFFFIYVSYIPVAEGTESRVMTTDQQEEVEHILEGFRREFSALFVSFPGDEERFGGCLSAGRGFVHINSSGGVEPCPFAPFSDVDVVSGSYMDALKSDLFSTIRKNRDKIEEHGGTCALFEHRDWLRSITAAGKSECEKQNA